MGKIETALKAEVIRLSRREIRSMTAKSIEEVRRLRQRVAKLEQELRSIKTARADEMAKRKIKTATETLSTEKGATVRLSPKLIRSLRKKLDISQAELAKLVGVSAVAVGSWESGRSKPRDESKARIAALRSLGRREARRLLA